MSIILGLTAVENKLYHINDHCGLLVEINIDNWQVKRYDLNFGRYKAYSKGIAYDNKLIFAPWAGEGNSILIFDRESGQSRELPLEENRLACDHGYFNDVMCVNDRIFFIPFQYGALVEYIPDEERIEYHSEVIDNTIPQCANKNDTLYFRFAALWNKSVLIMPYTSFNRVVTYDINSGRYDYFDLDVECKGFINICIDNDLIYLLAKNKGELYLYDYSKKKQLETIEILDGEEDFFMNMVESEDGVIILQRFAEQSYKITKKTRKVMALNLKSEEYKADTDINILCVNKIDSNRFIMTLRMDRSDRIGIYHIDSGKTEWHYVPELKTSEMYYEMTQGNRLFENDFFSLRDYIYEMKNIRLEKKELDNKIHCNLYEEICNRTIK